MLAFTVTPQVVAIGALTGLAYAVLAAGLILVYRATRVINFAHGQIGSFGAAVLALLVINLEWNFFLALAVVCLIGATIGLVIELTVVRRLFAAPRLILLVATIGVSQLLLFAEASLPGIETGERYPTPLDRMASIGSLNLLSEHFMVIAFVPAAIVGLTVFLGYTPQGIAIRASAENPDAARLAGISIRRISTMVWVLAGVLSTLTAVLINPLRGSLVGVASEAIGPGLLLRALAVALVGRLTSLPRALAGGLVIGIIEAVLFANHSRDPGIVDLAIALLVVGLVLVQRPGNARLEGAGPSLTPQAKAIPDALRAVPWVRRLPLIATGVALLIAALLPFVFDSASQRFLFTRVPIYAIIGLSLTVLIGWAGQLSLGQFAFVAVGAFGTASLTARGMPFGIAVVYSVVAGVGIAVLVGFPALRIRGLFLAVTTLAFAVATRSYFTTRPIFNPGGGRAFVERPEFLGIDFSGSVAYYELCLLMLVAAAAVTVALRKSGVGRTLIAVRENEASASAFTVSPARAKLTAFAVSGGLAALAGGLLAGLAQRFGPEAFQPSESLRVVAMTIIGGLGSVPGAILGAIYVLGVPAAFGDTVQARALTSGVGLLVLLMYLPGGLSAVLYAGRDALLRLIVRRSGVTSDAVPARPVAVPTRRERVPVEAGVAALEAADITVRFDGRVVVDDVSIRVAPGEVVGLIGSNGAGKSTLMNAVSGFVPAEGTVRVYGQDVTGAPPHVRARAGLGRAFQEARLFGDLTVLESISVALEAREPSELVPSLLTLPPSRKAERAKRSDAAELAAFLGLGRYADMPIVNLSTGTRRIVELACLLALDTQLLLLDEPTAGVAQRETEAFGPLLERIQTELSAAIVIIEHDMPLVMALSDRMYCLGAGKVIAEGTPSEVRENPKVVASYLGTDERAINRSDSTSRPSSRKRPAPVEVKG